MENSPDLNAQRAYYDERWRPITRANHLQLGRALAILEALHTLELKDPRFLDLGCGIGWLSAILGRFGPTTALDLSPLAIERARELHPDVEFIAGDLFSVSLPPASFDVVASVQVIEHVEDSERFVELIADVLRPGGHLFLVTDNPWNLARWRKQDLARFAGKPQPIQNRLSPGRLRHLLGARFTNIRIQTILPGHGDRGVLRVAHSVKLRNLLKTMGLRVAYDRLLLRAGCGLLLFVQAQRRA